MSKKTSNIYISPPKNGVDLRYHPNGKIQSKIPFVNSMKQGQVTRWYEGGPKEVETMYADGKIHGWDTGWYDSGQKCWEEMWRDGSQHGMSRQWHENGQKRHETMWRDDVRHGLRTRWYEDGGKMLEIYRIGDKKFVRIEWDEKGEVIEAEFPITNPNSAINTALQTNKSPAKGRQTSPPQIRPQKIKK